jgi:acyl carrier protein
MNAADRQQILRKLHSLFQAEFLADQSFEVDETTKLLELGILDSFSILRLVSLIEAEFQVELPMETLHLDNIGTLNAMADLVQELKGTEC